MSMARLLRMKGTAYHHYLEKKGGPIWTPEGCGRVLYIALPTNRREKWPPTHEVINASDQLLNPFHPISAKTTLEPSYIVGDAIFFELADTKDGQQ